MSASNDDIWKCIQICIKKLSELGYQIENLLKQYGHISAELQRLRQQINKGVKS
ncbi:MAG: hypothetical protein IKP88_14780 [Lachnospiraceae bacterium]|nr:hypothetical protein [Lachnospiraceae bacterium]